MGKVKAWIMDIEEDIMCAVGDDKIIDKKVLQKIADANGATVAIVEEVYEDIQKEYYGEW